MAIDQKKEIVIQAASAAAVLPYVAIAAEHDTTDGEQTAQQIASQGGYIVRIGGVPCAGFTVTKRDGECYVTAAGAIANRADMTRIITQALSMVEGVRSIAFQTRRQGLVRKAQKIGYQQAGTVSGGTGIIMRKTLC